MSLSIKLKPDDSYLIVKKKEGLRSLNRQAGEVFFSGNSVELCAILVEAMRTHEFIRVVVHFADEEYQNKYGDGKVAQDAVRSMQQLELSF